MFTAVETADGYKKPFLFTWKAATMQAEKEPGFGLYFNHVLEICKTPFHI